MYRLKIYPLGIDYSTKELLFQPIDEQDFGKALYESLKKFGDTLGNLSNAISKGTTFRGELVSRTVNINDPRQAGWTFLINEKDPHRNDIIDAIRPLAEHRGMADPDSPLLFDGTSQDDWIDWIQNEYQALDLEPGKKAPHYILIVGDPIQVPFHFQSMLDTLASVGRVDFDTVDDLKSYVKKIIRLEKAASPVVTSEATFFATNHGQTARGLDPTYFSYNYMAKPLTDHVNQNLGFQVTKIMENQATKQNLLSSLKNSKSALVYTASHGMGASGENSREQKRVTGGICCQNVAQPGDEGLLTGDDIPQDTPFLEGAVFFQFACFGYGTPEESDLSHWQIQHGAWKMPEKIAETDFVASLPKKMLANPRGPIAFIGHVDTALLHGFDDPKSPYPVERWNVRIQPFLKSIEALLNVMPIGLAMNDMNTRYDIENARLTLMYDRLQRGKVKDIIDFQLKLSDSFLSRTDAQNYMVFGDPAAHLRIANDDLVKK